MKTQYSSKKHFICGIQSQSSVGRVCVHVTADDDQQINHESLISQQNLREKY